MSKLRPDLKLKVEKLLEKNPADVAKAVDDVVKDKIGRFSREEVDIFIENLEKAYKEGKVTLEIKQWWLKRFSKWILKQGGEFVVIGIIWQGLKVFENVVKNNNQIPQEKKNEYMKLIEDTINRVNAIKKANLSNDFDKKMKDANIVQYEDKYKQFFNQDDPNEKRNVPQWEEHNIKMWNFVITSYLGNPNQNFDGVLKSYFNEDTSSLESSMYKSKKQLDKK